MTSENHRHELYAPLENHEMLSYLKLMVGTMELPS